MLTEKYYYVYIMTNSANTVFYTGITNDLIKRVYEHKGKLAEGFTKKYNATKLVYYEIFEDSYNAISREKQIKSGSRSKKILMINKINPDWSDLWEEIASSSRHFGTPRNDGIVIASTFASLSVNSAKQSHRNDKFYSTSRGGPRRYHHS